MVSKQLSIGSFAIMTIILISVLGITAYAWISPATFGIETATFENVIGNYWVGLTAWVGVILMFLFGKIE